MLCITVCYNLCMEKTLTVRLDTAQDRALTARAKATGRTKSELVRDLIDRAVRAEPMHRRVGHLQGRVELPRVRSGWRGQLRARNWR